MRHTSTWGRRTFSSVLALGLTAGVTTLSGSTPAAAAPTPATPVIPQQAPEDPSAPKGSPAATLGSHDADLLAQAEAAKKPSVTVIIATDSGKTADVAARVKSLGATVSTRVDQVGYVLASVPTGKVLSAAELPGVSAVDLDETVKVPTPETDRSGGHGTQPATGPGAKTPAANPYLPTQDTGSVDFKKKHPAYDGRGITIGIMDTGVDLDHPALQKTTTGDRKITDWFTATDPLTEGDGTWRAMLTSVSGPSFTYNGVQWKAPAGTWKINRFLESSTAANEDELGDVNRDGDTTDWWGILYDPVTHDIRVDANDNHDFTDDAVMRPYGEKFQIGHFGTDNPATAVVERMPFVVEYRQNVDLTPGGLLGQVADMVNIGIPEGFHATHVAGIAAGDNLLGNKDFDGQAPGAKIVSAKACWGTGCTAAALTTGMVELVVNRHVDVVNMSIGGLPALNDGNSARALLYNKLINDYGVQIVVSAGNSGPGANTVGDPSTAIDVISAAASITDDTWLANYNAVTRRPTQIMPFSSRGPREDGGFKPDLSAPGSAISAVPTWDVLPPVSGIGYTLPNGYSMQNGTSMAAPEITGGAALLLSAAKANRLTVTPASLRKALYSTAGLIPGESVIDQGNGLMNVPAAWNLLAKRSPVRTYTSSAPVCTPLSSLLATPNAGTGYYNRCASSAGGLKAGQTTTYSIKVTRTSGPAFPVLHRLTWVGDTGAYSSEHWVALPLGKTVSIPVTVRARAGDSSAILRVDDPLTPIVDFEVMNTVITGADAVKPTYAQTFTGAVDRNSTTSYYVTVPTGATALQVDLSGIAAGSNTRWIAINPWGVPIEDTSSLSCYTNFSDPAACNPTSRAYANPIPGVWEFEVESRRTSPLLSNPYQLTAKIQGVTVTPATVTLPSVKAGTPTPVSWTVTNAYGPLTLTARGGPLGSLNKQRPTIADGDTASFTVTVPDGTQRLDVAIGNPSDATSDLDLFVYNAAGTLVAQQADGDAEEAVSIANPPAGTYTVQVDGYDVPSGTTQYDYLDAYYSPALGSLAVPSTPLTLASAASATVTGTVTAATVPPAGRSLTGDMTLVTDAGAIVGRGTVAISAVTP